jgi:hypothetical protein
MIPHTYVDFYEKFYSEVFLLQLNLMELILFLFLVTRLIDANM